MKLLPRLILLAALAPAAYSQSVLYTFRGDSVGDLLGYSVSGAGDVNGDGYPDLIVGAISDDNNGGSSGSARVFSGVDGSILYTFNGDSEDDRFGCSVSGAGDVNRDGFADLIVGAYMDDNNGFESGSARVLSGANGSTLYTFDGDAYSVWFGTSVSGAGDVNGDGYADVIVGGYMNNPGTARVFSGLEGRVLYTFIGNHDSLGNSVSGAGDVNGDGFDDLIVGAPSADVNGSQSGSAFVFSGADGSILYSFHGDSGVDWFGTSVSGAGDVNADGYDDLIVGAPDDDNNGTDSGSARVFSGFDGSILYTFNGESQGIQGDHLGYSVSSAGDVNGDGYDDLIAGAPGDDNNGPGSGSAIVFSGFDGSTLHILNGQSQYFNFGWSVSGAGDVNGDGFADLVGGAIQGQGHGNDSGTAYVFSGCSSCGLIGQNYCGPANFNSTGQSAVIAASGSTKISFNSVTLTASRVPLNVFGYFLNSDVQDFKPFPPGSKGNLCLGGGIGRHAKKVANSGNVGELVIALDLTALPRPNGTHAVVVGETWNFQCWFRDNAGGPTSNFTDGIEIVFR